MKRLLQLLCVLLLASPLAAQPKTGGPTSPDGKVAVQVDLPLALRLKNSGGNDRTPYNPRGEPGKGSGLCVFTSIEHAARWQGEHRLLGYQEKKKHEPGGGNWEIVEASLKKHAPGVNYLQYVGADLGVFKAALDGGLLPCVTWNGYKDPHYSGPIMHMLNVVCVSGLGDSDWVAILDNNRVGENDLVWMRPRDFLAGFAGRGSGWAVFLLDRGPPPPVPVNTVGNDDGTDPWGGVVYEWKLHSASDRYLLLYRKGGRQVGAYDLQLGHFRHFDWERHDAGRPERDCWLSPCRPPFPVPVNSHKPWKRGEPVQAVQDFGLVGLDQMPYRQGKDEKWAHNGKSIDRASALKLLARHAGKRALTVVLPRAERERVLQDLAGGPLLAPWKDALVVQGYEPGDALHAGVGLPQGIVLQAAPDSAGKGKVLHRQAAYTGPADLAKALRRTDPNYDPARDPDLARAVPPKLSPAGEGVPAPVSPLVPAAAIVAAGVALASLKRMVGD